MKKVNLYALTVAMEVFFLPFQINAVSQSTATQENVSKSQVNSSRDEEDEEEEDEYEILERNQIDDTDVLAIPLDDSEVEDEEEINAAEKREVFQLPRAR